MTDETTCGSRALARAYGQLVLTGALPANSDHGLVFKDGQIISASRYGSTGGKSQLDIELTGNKDGLSIDDARRLASMLLGLADAQEAHNAVPSIRAAE